MATDRTLLKNFQKGQLLTAGLSNSSSAVDYTHQHTRDFLKTGTENAATNVAESPMHRTISTSTRRIVGVVLLPTANVASDNTDYVVINFYKRISGTSTRVAWWNTHGGANGALTGLSAHACNVVSNSDKVVAGGAIMTYNIAKYGAGKAIDPLAVFSIGYEDI
jgi:glucose-6-phosphate dehydrogenase assembly protein OpcA